MPKEITMPLLSPSMTVGKIVRWMKREGESVKPGEVLAEIETDKATMELEAYEEGFLQKILLPEGSEAPVGSPIALLAQPEESHLEPTPPAAEEKKAVSSVSVGASSPIAPPSPSGSQDRLRVSPLARKLAASLGVDLSSVRGSGPGGRIVQRDVLAAAEQTRREVVTQPAEAIGISSMRATIARRLLESKTTIPHFYLGAEVDVDSMEELREKLNGLVSSRGEAFKFTVNDFIAKAVVEAARRVPEVNASWAGEKILRFPEIHLAVAVALSEGLITPVVRSAEKKTLRELAQSLRELVAQAREGKLKPEDYTGGTLTLSNLGMYGVDWFLAIINPPQALIVAVGAVAKKPVVGPNDEVRVRKRLPITLSCDHRVIDGATAANYLRELRSLLEEPLWLLSSP
ncbi:dihydrolipoamide acetyltransferase family protein [Candidatus Methylacidithermus pantelleriae]|uniref:Dihydrolipoamide acetyltransferase component of pyruvate dehydrogenase complex n=1 Tax=Candidatus Methylacidithermus pantelleriae TaxID=2744239 RepID=A0A8J2FSZ3_9BACT|nr:dihydrolipoamide acetyltransferase family protein [Candidatus Methylacidithermus pantelleriae]CAF0701812.1 Pyruvate dehydrogenase, subunit gamma (acetyltransferase component) [Candidatus Methylacidithermus pantelleriae]